jgi:hypothetical protein
MAPQVSLLVRGIDIPTLPPSNVANGKAAHFSFGNEKSLKGKSNLIIEIYGKDISPECCAWLLEVGHLV